MNGRKSLWVNPTGVRVEEMLEYRGRAGEIIYEFSFFHFRLSSPRQKAHNIFSHLCHWETRIRGPFVNYQNHNLKLQRMGWEGYLCLCCRCSIFIFNSTIIEHFWHCNCSTRKVRIVMQSISDLIWRTRNRDINEK